MFSMAWDGRSISGRGDNDLSSSSSSSWEPPPSLSSEEVVVVVVVVVGPRGGGEEEAGAGDLLPDRLKSSTPSPSSE